MESIGKIQLRVIELKTSAIISSIKTEKNAVEVKNGYGSIAVNGWGSGA